MSHMREYTPRQLEEMKQIITERRVDSAEAYELKEWSIDYLRSFQNGMSLDEILNMAKSTADDWSCSPIILKALIDAGKVNLTNDEAFSLAYELLDLRARGKVME